MPRIINRYANRKLYDTEASAYVSLADIATLVRGGETVQILDKKTGEDLTAQTLTQVILEEGKQGRNLLPTELLHDLLRRSGDVIDQQMAQLRQSADHLMQHTLGRLNPFRDDESSSEISALRKQLGQLEQLLSRVLDTPPTESDDTKTDTP